jgi:hypothetical protein
MHACNPFRLHVGRLHAASFASACPEFPQCKQPASTQDWMSVNTFREAVVVGYSSSSLSRECIAPTASKLERGTVNSKAKNKVIFGRPFTCRYEWQAFV